MAATNADCHLIGGADFDSKAFHYRNITIISPSAFKRFERCARLFYFAGGLFDKGRDGFRVGDINSVTARHLDDGGAGSFRHELLS